VQHGAGRSREGRGPVAIRAVRSQVVIRAVDLGSSRAQRGTAIQAHLGALRCGRLARCRSLGDHAPRCGKKGDPQPPVPAGRAPSRTSRSSRRATTPS
jgi:hypothetical protein